MWDKHSEWCHLYNIEEDAKISHAVPLFEILHKDYDLLLLQLTLHYAISYWDFRLQIQSWNSNRKQDDVAVESISKRLFILNLTTFNSTKKSPSHRAPAASIYFQFTWDYVILSSQCWRLGSLEGLVWGPIVGVCVVTRSMMFFQDGNISHFHKL